MSFFREIRGGVVRDSVHYTRILSLKSFSFQGFGISFFPEVSSNTQIVESQYEIIFKQLSILVQNISFNQADADKTFAAGRMIKKKESGASPPV